MEKLKRNYYAILPANVRYDKDITPNAKLLYAEITALCNEKGYCWATNDYFADLYNISDRTIRRLISQLSDKKYIVVELTDNTKRKIYINSDSKTTLKQNDNNFIDYDWLNNN